MNLLCRLCLCVIAVKLFYEAAQSSNGLASDDFVAVNAFLPIQLPDSLGRKGLIMTQNNPRIQYTVDELKSLRNLPYRLSMNTYSTIKDLNILKKRRGSRAGSRVQKRISVRITKKKKNKVQTTRVRDKLNIVSIQSKRTEVKLPTVYMTNTQSLNNKMEEFTVVARDYDPDLVSVSETWFDINTVEAQYNIPGYLCQTKNRIGRRGGGVALYIKDCMNPTPVTFISVPPELEVIWMRLRPHRLPRNVSSIFVASVYYPPNHPDNKEGKE